MIEREPVSETWEHPASPSSQTVTAPRPMIAENRLILGRKGSGKSSLSRSLVHQYPRTLVIDPFLEYADLCTRVRDLHELRDALSQTHGTWHISYSNRHLREDFPMLCQVAMQLGDCMIILEETPMHCSSHKIGPEFLELVEYGRHALEEETGRAHPVGLIAMSRTPTEIHTMIRSQSWELDCFSLQEPAHLEWAEAVCGEEFADGLLTLPPAHYRALNLVDRTVPWEERMTDPKFRTRGYDGWHRTE